MASCKRSIGEVRFIMKERGRVQKGLWALELLNFHLWIKRASFNEWVKYFVWYFKGDFWYSTQNISPIHWKTRFLYNVEIWRAIAYTCFWNAPRSRTTGVLTTSVLRGRKSVFGNGDWMSLNRMCIWYVIYYKLLEDHPSQPKKGVVALK